MIDNRQPHQPCLGETDTNESISIDETTRIDASRSIDESLDMGHETWETRHGTQDMGHETWDTRHGTRDMGHETWDMGHAAWVPDQKNRAIHTTRIPQK